MYVSIYYKEDDITTCLSSVQWQGKAQLDSGWVVGSGENLFNTYSVIDVRK